MLLFNQWGTIVIILFVVFEFIDVLAFFRFIAVIQRAGKSLKNNFYNLVVETEVRMEDTFSF